MRVYLCGWVYHTAQSHKMMHRRIGVSDTPLGPIYIEDEVFSPQK